jgi:hypothetical protein
MPKKFLALRASEHTHAQLAELVALMGATKTEVVEIAVDRLHQQLIKGKEPTMETKATWTIKIIPATKRGMDGGAICEDEDGHQLCHLPMSLEDAADKMHEDYPEAKVRIVRR